ncbi:MAG: AAA family ATPase, partial [Ignavibacteriales bacterium UTCHB3]
MKSINLKIEENLLLTPAQTMETVLEAIKEVIPYELAVILSKEENDHLKVRYASGPLKSEKLMQFEIELNKRPDISAALKAGEVRLIEDTDEPDHHDTYEGVLDLPLGHSCMLAPLKVNDETLGLMTLDHRECDIFTSQRVKITETLSQIVALALAQSLATDKLLDINEALVYERNNIIGEDNEVFAGMIGRSKKWLQVVERIKLVAPTGSHVMILGETGTGKELTANAVHRLSQRATAPFIALNCSALNSSLAESELFGHEKGAFTGAFSARKGRFELANNGTLFLDEIGDLPLDIQPKLLRAIQEGTFERVGGEKIISSDVRIICATHVNLEERVAQGKFREDLYYRLNVFPIVLPPLRERIEDIGLLASFFLERISKKFGNRHFYLSDTA